MGWGCPKIWQMPRFLAHLNRIWRVLSLYLKNGYGDGLCPVEGGSEGLGMVDGCGWVARTTSYAYMIFESYFWVDEENWFKTLCNLWEIAVFVDLHWLATSILQVLFWENVSSVWNCCLKCYHSWLCLKINKRPEWFDKGCTKWTWQTDTVIIGSNSLHLMGLMQPNNCLLEKLPVLNFVFLHFITK